MVYFDFKKTVHVGGSFSLCSKLLAVFIADLLRTSDDGRNRLALLLWIRVKSGRLIDALHRCTNNDQLSHLARSTY